MKKIFALLPIVALSCSMNANAGFLDGLSNVLTKTSNVLGKVPGVSPGTATSSNSAYKAVPMAQITDAQAQRINQIVQANTDDRDLNRAIMEAKPTIQGVMRLASCQTEDMTLRAGQYLSPTAVSVLAVIPNMQYKSLNHCTTVSSIGGWRIQSRSRLDYHLVDKISANIVYTSDVTAETQTRNIFLEREPNGQWYVKNHN